MDQIRLAPELRSGVAIDDYVTKMDRAGIDRSLLVAVRAGDSRITGSTHIPCDRVAQVCNTKKILLRELRRRAAELTSVR